MMASYTNRRGEELTADETNETDYYLLNPLNPL